MTASLAPFQFSSLAGTTTGGFRAVHGFTRRARELHHDGDMSFVTGGDTEAVGATRGAWARALEVEPTRMVSASLVHGNHVHVARAEDAGRGGLAPGRSIPNTDALITAQPGLTLLLTFADCTPLLFFDPRTPAVGVAHAGWRGTVADVGGATVRAMARELGSRPADLLVGIGPAIGRCCYTVRDDVAAAWRGISAGRAGALQEVGGASDRWQFDLPRANHWLLVRAGVDPARIETSGICTSCRVGEYFSHRAEQGHAGRCAAMIALMTAPGRA